jgi:NAD kinase
MMGNSGRDVAVYGGSFNPPGRHHRAIVERLLAHFEELIVVPCGPRPDKTLLNDVEPVHRAAMVDLNFRGLPGVRVELFDLESGDFTRTHELDRRFRDLGRLWHVVSDEFVRGGRNGSATIQSEWERGKELWREASFVVVNRTGGKLDPADLPPQHRLIAMDRDGSSMVIRGKVFHHQPVDDLVLPEVGRYIKRHGLYRGVAAPRQTRFRVDKPRLLIVADERNPVSKEVASALGRYADSDRPDLIVAVGGDGTMLHAIREHWRRRVPFYGINTGHLGFLLNDSRSADFLAKELVLYQMPLLRVEVDPEQGETRSALAFNDAWVERVTGQTAWLRLSVNGQEQIAHLVADGVLMATSAGSTSYARAMGAVPIPLNTRALLLVGSNVLKPASWKLAVLPHDARVEVTTLDTEKRPLQGFIDGVAQGRVRAMRVRASNIAAVELAFLPRHDPALKLAKIQFQ